MNFASDNTAGIAPEILQALVAGNAGFALGYGNDDVTRVLSYQAVDVLGDKTLVRLLREHESAEVPIHVLYPDGRHPPPKNSGAPHSSVRMCASVCANTAPHGGLTWASASAFAAVPVGTRNTAASRSKISPIRRSTVRVTSSLP